MVPPRGSLWRKPKRAGHSLVANDAGMSSCLAFAEATSVRLMIMTSRISAIAISMMTTSPMDRVNDSSGDDTGAPASSMWNLSPYSFDEF